MMERYDVILVIVTLLGLMGTIYSMFYKPLHELKIAINSLTQLLVSNINDLKKLEDRVNTHGKEIDKHQSILDRNNLI